MADLDSTSEYPWRDKRLLQKLFAWEGLTISELAATFNCSERTVENWLRRHEVSRPWEHEETLRFLRKERRLSQREIALRLGCTQGTISNRFDEFDIDSNRIISEKPWHNEETLRELYHSQGLSMRDIAEELGCDYQSIEHWIHHHEIETRPRNPPTPDKLQEDTILRTMYEDHGMSTYAIAEELDCAPSTVHDWLSEHDIETRSVGSQPGELHHRWEGGREPYYGDNWREMRRATLNRDDYTCRECGITQEEHEQEHSFGLDVHHVEPVVEFEIPEKANDMDNLIALCRSCHNAIEPRGRQS